MTGLRLRLRLRHLWVSLHSTYWFIPSLMALAAGGAAVGLVQLDRYLADDFAAKLGWIYTGGPEGARAVLSVVGGSVMGTAGVTFSITIAALSLASSQLGPRLLYNFMRDRGNQVVLGTFIASFVYCLLVLRTIRGGDEAGRFVPAISVTVGVGLGLTSLGVLIFFIHHVAVSIQAPNVVAAVGHDLARVVERGFSGEHPDQPRRQAFEFPDGFDERADRVPSARDGYVQAVDEHALLRLATKAKLLLAIERRPGQYVVEGAPLVRAWPPDRLGEKERRAIRALFVLGAQRTPEQDVEFAVDQLVEVAVRALSPGINDPFTAVGCLDWLGAALCRAGRGRTPSPLRTDDAGEVRVVHRCPISFAGLVDSAFNQIRQYGSGSPAVVLRILETIETVLRCSRGDPEEVAALLRHAGMVRRAGLEATSEPEDRAQIEDRYQDVLRARASPGS
jgi:uncharacterized membrane protein